MRLLADENIGRAMVEALTARGHDVLWIRADYAGSTDEQVVALAVTERRVVVTADKDFGELAFHRGMPATSGIILLRLRGTNDARLAALLSAIEARQDLEGQFVVVENDRIRMTSLPEGA